MKWLIVFLAGAWAAAAAAVPLSTISTFCAAYPDQCMKGTESLMAVRGTGTNAYYVLEADPATGALPVSVASGGGPIDVDIQGKTYADSARNAYASTSVGTGAWVQLIASTAATINGLTIFHSCSETIELGTGAALSETRKLIIPPGGVDGFTPLLIPSGTRVSVRAISGTCSTGEIDITGLQ